MTLLVINPPSDFTWKMEPLPQNSTIVNKAKSADQVHWFVTTRAQMERELNKVLLLLNENNTCWIYYPKGSSGIQTDLTRDKGWDKLLQQNMQWLSLVSFDDTWSAFGMRKNSENAIAKKKPAVNKAVLDYIDVKTKTIRLPADFEALLKKHTQQADFFNTLSFTNKKEYVDWIVSAKKEETRQNRLIESLERLGKKWKNPANR